MLAREPVGWLGGWSASRSGSWLAGWEAGKIGDSLISRITAADCLASEKYGPAEHMTKSAIRTFRSLNLHTDQAEELPGGLQD